MLLVSTYSATARVGFPVPAVITPCAGCWGMRPPYGPAPFCLECWLAGAVIAPSHSVQAWCTANKSGKLKLSAWGIAENPGFHLTLPKV